MKALKGIVLITIIIILGLGLGLYWAWSPLQNHERMSVVSFPIKALEQNSPSFTIVSLNLGYASGNKNNHGNVLSQDDITKNLDDIIAKLKQLNPDVIALQEIDIDSKRSHHINQVEVLAKALNLPHAAIAINWNHHHVPWPYWPLSRQFGQIISGQAILSRFPITAHTVQTFDDPPQLPFWYRWFYLDRLAQTTTIKLPSGTMNVINVHLEAFVASHRDLQAKQLFNSLKESTPFTVLAGDFNDPTKSRGENESTALSPFLNSGKWHHVSTNDKTYPSWAPIETLDHILVTDSLAKAPTEAGIIRSSGSDHYGVWVRFKSGN